MAPSPAPVYLDNAATTRPSGRVVEEMAQAHLQFFGNPSSEHELGRAARRLLEDSREFLRGTLGAGQVVFTSGGTEADLLGVAGAAAARSPGRVLAGAADHPAVLRQAELIGRFRHRFATVPVDSTGDLRPETLFEHLGSEVRVVSLLYGHNELGTLIELDELVGLVRRIAPDAHVHVDLVQTYGKLPFAMDDRDIDSVAVSAHKFHGPRGVGFLALRHGTRIVPLQPAGGQENGLRGGTENVAGAVGMAVAAEEALSHQARIERHTRSMAERLFEGLREAFPETTLLGHPDRRLPHVLPVRLPGIHGQTLATRCAARGIAFSTGSACHDTTEKETQNPVLAAAGFDRRAAREVLRFSFSGETTREEIDRATAVIIEEARSLVRQAPRKKTPR